MANEITLADSLRTALAGRLASEAATRGLKLVVGSNITPEITAYDASSTGSVLDLLGIVPYARVEDSSGNVVASYGETVPISWIRAAAIWGLVAVGLFAMIKGFARR